MYWQCRHTDATRATPARQALSFLQCTLQAAAVFSTLRKACCSNSRHVLPQHLLHPTAPVKARWQRGVLVGGEEAKQQPLELQLLQAARQLLVLRHEPPVVLKQRLQAGPPRLQIATHRNGDGCCE